MTNTSAAVLALLIASFTLICCASAPKNDDPLTNLIVDYSDRCSARCVKERAMSRQDCYELWKSGFYKMMKLTDKTVSREGADQCTALCDRETWDFLDEYKEYLKRSYGHR